MRAENEGLRRQSEPIFFVATRLGEDLGRDRVADRVDKAIQEIDTALQVR